MSLSGQAGHWLAAPCHPSFAKETFTFAVEPDGVVVGQALGHGKVGSRGDGLGVGHRGDPGDGAVAVGTGWVRGAGGGDGGRSRGSVLDWCQGGNGDGLSVAPWVAVGTGPWETVPWRWG